MEKEQRRRKIIARGTDRMALITGRLNNLDPDPISKCSSFSVPRQDPVPTQHARSSSEPLSAAEEALFKFDHHHGVDDATHAVMKHVEEVSKGNDQRKLEQKEVAALTSDHAYSPEKQRCIVGSITAKEINFSIMSTEYLRAVCSVVLAFIVVLSHLILPHNILMPKSLIAYKPLYIVLLTDLLIVAARLVPYAHIRKEDKEAKFEEDDNNIGGAFKYLELGLVLHQTLGAIFNDCCFYLVIVIFGLSLVQT